MARSCSVCNHEDSGQINLALTIGREAHRTIATRFGLSASAVQRHREHLVKKVVQAVRREEAEKDAKDAVQSIDILKQARFLYSLTLEALTNARTEDKPGVLLRAVEVALKNLTFLGQLMGEIDQEGTVNVHIANNIILEQKLVQFQTVVLQALERHPEAKASVLSGLRRLQLEGGEVGIN